MAGMGVLVETLLSAWLAYVLVSSLVSAWPVCFMAKMLVSTLLEFVVIKTLLHHGWHVSAFKYRSEH
jgi:hypothetical protein